jgi:GAF domain-containing protein
MPMLSANSWFWIRLVWFIAGAAFTFTRISRTGPDTTAIAGLVFTFAIFVFPLIKGLKLPGGTEIELKSETIDKRVDQLKIDADKAVDGALKLLATFTALITSTDVVLARPTSRESRSAFARMNCGIAIEAALSWFAVGERVRVLVYRFIAVPPDPGLHFLMGNATEDECAILARGYFRIDDSDEPLLTSWRDQRIINMPDAIATDRPETLPGLGAYHGILCVPLWRVDTLWGLLVIERTNRETFNAAALKVADALGNVLVAALAHPGLVEEPVRTSRV